MESAVNTVANCGFHGASIKLIAGHAGVAAGTVYVHFESKDHSCWRLTGRWSAAVSRR